MSKHLSSSYSAVKRRIFQIVETAQPGDIVSLLFDSLILFLIVFSIATIILQSYDEINAQYAVHFLYLERFTIIVFSIEYLLRLWTADLAFPNSKYPRLRYIFSFLALADLVAILPFYLPFANADARFLRVFRMLRLLRIFKIKRYFSAFQTVFDVVKDSAYQLVVSLSVCVFIIFLSGIVMYTVENGAQPDVFPNVPAALWWAVNALTTVGYGDAYPITPVGKLFASILNIVGIGVIALPAGIISAGFLKALENKRNEPAPEQSEVPPKVCPHCGKRID